MNHRLACVLGVLVVWCLALPTAAVAQNGDIPRTSSGRPDLSGTYDVSTLTPMERPEDLGEKMFLTDEEAAEIAAAEQERMARRNAASDPNRSAPPRRWQCRRLQLVLDRPGHRRVPDRRTVADVDPH